MKNMLIEKIMQAIKSDVRCPAKCSMIAPK